jgi:hypothetical protein
MSRWQILGLVSLAAVCGCEPRREQHVSPLAQDEIENVVVILLDMSGSYAARSGADGEAYGFALQVVDRYFRNSIGSNDRLVLAQISGTEKSLLWEGTPIQLRQKFSTADEFHRFLQAKSSPHGSRVHSGAADALDYVLAFPGVANDTTRSAVFVLSDMLDNFPDSEQSKQRLLRSLAAYSQSGGAVGLYWVDSSLLAEWRANLRNAGIKNFVVESEIVADPALPTFE